MKIIHIWNTGGIGGLIARYMDRLYPTESVCYMWGRWDPFKKATEKVHVYTTPLGNRWGKLKVPFLLFKCMGKEIIHIHSLDGLVPWARLLYPTKYIILHYHGTRIREKWNKKGHLYGAADKILVSTEDLLEGAPEGTEYVPNLIDWDMIEEVVDSELGPRYPDNLFHVTRYADDLADEYAQRWGLNLVLFDRDAAPLPAPEFLREMVKHGFYLDCKRDFFAEPDAPPLRAHSLTGLEAQALGLRVINWDGEEADINLSIHYPETVTAQLWKIYEKGVRP